MHAMQVLAAAAGGAGGQGVPARPKMPTTLGFHIILACFGIAFPTVVLVAEFRGLSRSDDVAMLLARRWSQVLGVLVAVGAVTGTVLSFEMGLLWPGLMRTYGAVLGVPFGFEGIFFFLEAIFTGIYLYGWQRLPGWAHFWTGTPIAITGRVHAEPREGGGRRSVAGLLQPGLAVRDPAHDPRGLHGGRLPDRVGVRGRDPAGPPGPLPPARFRDPVHHRRRPDARSDLRRRHRRPGRRQPAAGQVRRDRVRHPHRPRRA